MSKRPRAARTSPSRNNPEVGTDRGQRHGVARTLSRMGICSRSEAERVVRDGRVALNGVVVRDPETPVLAGIDGLALDGVAVGAQKRFYVAMHKPRGLVVSANDERGRDTVYTVLQDAGLPWLAPVGRLDRASEGLLLMSNDPAWAARITDPATHVEKTYRVQVRGVVGTATLQHLRTGIVDRGELLSLCSVCVVGGGDRNSWLEVVLDEGRNRQIRRMLAACGHEVLRLLRVAIGALQLGDLPKGGWRHLDAGEVAALSGPPRRAAAGAARAAVKPARVPRRSRSPSAARPRRPR